MPAGISPHGIDPTTPTFSGKSCFLGIAANVLNYSIQVLFIADDSVVTFLLPEFSRQLYVLVDESRSRSLDPAKFRFEIEAVKWSHREVTMVGHDDETSDLVTLIKEVQDRPM